MNIGIIGSGNMASALASGLISSGIVRADEISISDKLSSNLIKWEKTGVFTTEDNNEVYEHSDIVIFAVKPNVMPVVLAEASSFSRDKLFISIAAGVTLEKLGTVLGNSAKIIRAMPNTPAQVGCGMTVISPNKNVSTAELQLVKKLLSGVGEVTVLEEKYINAATALHGSSPAYVYMLIDAMADSGVKYGISKEISLKLAAKAVEGAAKMVLESGKHPQELKDNVCSPGGTTIEAVCELEKNGFSMSVQQAIKKCVEKGDLMSKS